MAILSAGSIRRILVTWHTKISLRDQQQLSRRPAGSDV
jgi:hypothetical protein